MIDAGASLIEINPLITTDSGELKAIDAKLNVDDNELFRKEEIAKLRDVESEASEEVKARSQGLTYIKLDGDVGCCVNGAGLAMATMDLVKYYGGEPANFLDIGGGAKAERVANALDMVFSDENVDAVVFNIFGGITRGDEVAKGINEALAAFDELPAPVVVRLAGTRADEGRELLAADRLEVAETAESAVQRAIELAGGAG